MPHVSRASSHFFSWSLHTPRSLAFPFRPRSTFSPQPRTMQPYLFVCDIQEKFRRVHAFDAMVHSSRKLLRAAEILDWPVVVTTQLCGKLGPVVPELDVSRALVSADKSKFSMLVPAVLDVLEPGAPVAIVGIESHVCVLQTARDLRARGHPVYVVADAVSSMNSAEIPIALQRMASEGATITTSESLIFEAMGDAAIPQFRAISSLVKESAAETSSSLEALVPAHSSKM